MGGEMQVVPTKVPTAAFSPLLVMQAKLLRGLEARAGIEPAHKGFADLSLTTWVPRLGPYTSHSTLHLIASYSEAARNGAGDET